MRAQESGIEWTESTWDSVIGCNKNSPGSRAHPASSLAASAVSCAALVSQRFEPGGNHPEFPDGSTANENRKLAASIRHSYDR